jgi:hypothetical protein
VTHLRVLIQGLPAPTRTVPRQIEHGGPLCFLGTSFISPAFAKAKTGHLQALFVPSLAREDSPSLCVVSITFALSASASCIALATAIHLGSVCFSCSRTKAATALEPGGSKAPLQTMKDGVGVCKIERKGERGATNEFETQLPMNPVRSRYKCC